MIKLKNFTLVIALIFLGLLQTSLAFAQRSESVQMAANTVATPPVQPTAPVTPSISVLQHRIEAQQEEIDRLSAVVEKLQALVASATSSQPAVASASLGVDPAASSPSPAALPSPAASPAPISNAVPRELLPDIGQIGAQLGILAGGATNPYKDNTGFAAGGYIDLPWKNVPGGKISYEIMVGLQRAVTQTTTTSGVNVLVNAVLNTYLGNTASNSTSLTNYLAGPLPITSTVQERSKVLTVAPFELKYTVSKLGRFRPYVLAGVGAYVWIGSESNTATFNANTSLGALASAPVGTSTLGATLNSLLQGSQIGGLVPEAPQLAARGVPHGQGNLLFGGQFGGGAEFRITPKLSIGADFRRNLVEGSNASFNSFSFKEGLHW